MSRYTFARRSFLQSIAGAAGMAQLLRTTEAAAAGAQPAKRLMVIHRPNGTIRSNWLPKGAGTGAVVGSILAPFQKDPKVKASMVVVDGLDIKMVGGGEDSHEGPLVTLMCGTPLAGIRNDMRVNYINSNESLDYTLAYNAASLKGTPFPALQVAAHDRPDGPTVVPNRVMTYAAKDKPLYPELKPSLVYNRLFGSMMPAQNAEALAKARAKRKSVLDFIRADLDKLTKLAPANQRDKIDAHAAAIRELETTLDANGMAGATCERPAAATDQVADDSSANVQKVGKAMLAIVKAAFACDLSRVVSYMWSAAASQVQFEGLYPGMPKSTHHPLSHEDTTKADVAKGITAIETFYAQLTADFLSELAAASNGRGGNLLDDTLVLYTTEISVPDHHTFKQMPYAIFGGNGVNLKGDRIVSYPGRSTNDLWLSLIPQFGMTMDKIGTNDQWKGPLAGLFG